MPKIYSLDELLERAYERERLYDQSSSDEDVSVSYLLEELPEERTEAGYYDGMPLDLVSLFRRAA